MSTTSEMRAVMRQYDLTEPMVRAVFSGADDAVIDCNWRTEAALVERRLMHRTMSNLTPEGRDVLVALKAAEGVIELAAPAPVQAPAPKVVEGVIVSHAGTAKGCLPKHVDDSDTRAAIEALDNLKLAELADHFEPDEGTDVRGFMVEPRGNGRVALYWVFGGSIRDHNREPWKVELEIGADKLRKAGWRIEPKSVFCVFAWRPIAETMHEDAVRMENDAAARLPQLKNGDYVEAETVSDMPQTIKVTVTGPAEHAPGEFGTVLRDVWGPVTVKTDSVRVINEAATAPVPPMSAAMQRNIDAANDLLAGVDFGEDEPTDAPLARFAVAVGPDERMWIGFHEYDRALRCATEYGLGADAIRDRRAPERLRDDRSYAIQWGTDDGQWHGSIVSSAITGDEIGAYVADVQALANPGVTVRAVEIRLTHTVLPAASAAVPSDVDHGPVTAHTVRSGCRVDLYGAERLVYRVEYLHAGNYLRLHTVPPAGEHPGYFTFTKSPSDLVELISRGPAVDVTGRPVDDAR
ncbi:hypothetical protein ACGF3G_00525 [Streptomyces sp. NPDC048179]|uniref:hypothetical protein n=1 Tax=Streptomyces sp. NPDC048179 TaxID=3365506 RepID=UPI003724BC9A